ncbi:MAG: type I-E CRISPR-associated protein Cse1/CasA [Ruminococcus sp.]|nr:type I-E CRISPR-associated protein Cse1/CasA [Ruminococcus sp.]
MGRYNLLDEKWIQVLLKNGGGVKKVSLKEVFSNAGDYYDLAGEMKTQDFAVLRVLLAVLQTVFSRFDSEGNPYDFLEIDEETFTQKEPADWEDLDDEDPFFETWLSLWEKGEFPEIVQDYLEAFRDRFYLFDDKYPFYQITPEQMKELASGGGQFFGKNLNRTISESNNKIAMFAPITGKAEDKDKLCDDQLARWLIMLQGYTGTGDKKKVELKDVKDKKITYSKGWLYDLGGLYLKGNNLFETLMLNCILSSDFDKKLSDEMRTQIPAWERSPRENVEAYFHNKLDNRASIYTSWSRALSISQDYQEGSSFSCFIAKLPEINHVENFLEPMTCWQFNKAGDNKDKFTPKKHQQEKAVWRNFNVLMGVGLEEGERFQKPGIISWYQTVCEDDSMSQLRNFKVTINSVSMQDDGNATSWAPVDEIIDEIQMETAVLIDNNKDGWIETINTLVNKTKEYIENTLVRFARQVSAIRGYDSKDYHYVEQQREGLYLEIDQHFRNWLYEIDENDSTNEKSLEWYRTLKEAILNRGNEIFKNATYKDLKGIKNDNGLINIATEYSKFKRNISVQFKFLQEGGKQ